MNAAKAYIFVLNTELPAEAMEGGAGVLGILAVVLGDEGPVA